MKNGILLINKPSGMTSRDVVNVICKKFNTRKVGHAGTLDPLASGLLIICLNKATGLIELLSYDDKEYIANVRLGLLTDTLDITGNIIKEDYNYKLDKDELIKTLNSFIGSYEQEVPLYSSIKVNGKRLYDYARKNKEVILPKREVEIKEISLIDFNNDCFSFKVRVSKGTYIRSLIRDIGNKLNILMTMEGLIRTEVDNYKLEDAIELNNINEDNIIPVEKFLNFYKVNVDDKLRKKVLNGVRLKNIYNKEYVMFMDNNKLIAIYKNNNSNELCMFKCFKDN